MNKYSGNEIVNVGTGIEVSIKELAHTVMHVVGYQGKLRFDPTKPDGTPRKLLDCTKQHTMGWNHVTELEEGVARSYDDFIRRSDRGEI